MSPKSWSSALAAISGRPEALIVELWSERSAYLEYSAGFDRDEAERLARLDVEGIVLMEER